LQCGDKLSVGTGQGKQSEAGTVFRRKRNQPRPHARIFVGHGLQHILEGQQPTGFLFKLQLGQLCVKVGLNCARFVERQRDAKLSRYALN